MEGRPLLTTSEFKSLLALNNQRGNGDDDNSRIYEAIDKLLAVAWKRCIGVERYMLLRLTERGEPYEIQALRFEGWGCTTAPFIRIGGSRLTPSGVLGRKLYRYELLGKTHVERRMLDGTWRSLGIVLPGALA